MLIGGWGAFVDWTAVRSESYKMSSQPKLLDSCAVEGDSPVGEGNLIFLAKVPEYRGTRGTPWESGRTIFQG